MTDILEILALCLGAGFVIAGIRYAIERIADALRIREARRRARPVLYVVPGPTCEDVERRIWQAPPSVRRVGR